MLPPSSHPTKTLAVNNAEESLPSYKLSRNDVTYAFLLACLRVGEVDTSIDCNKPVSTSICRVYSSISVAASPSTYILPGTVYRLCRCRLLRIRTSFLQMIIAKLAVLDTAEHLSTSCSSSGVQQTRAPQAPPQAWHWLIDYLSHFLCMGH